MWPEPTSPIRSSVSPPDKDEPQAEADLLVKQEKGSLPINCRHAGRRPEISRKQSSEWRISCGRRGP